MSFIHLFILPLESSSVRNLFFYQLKGSFSFLSSSFLVKVWEGILLLKKCLGVF